VDRIVAYGLPAFYVDGYGRYGVVIKDTYICCFINSDDGLYDVTRDTVDSNGDFALNLDWFSTDDPSVAIQMLRDMVKLTVKGK